MTVDVDTRSLLAISVSDTFSVRSYATFCRTRLEIWQFFSTIDVLATVFSYNFYTETDVSSDVAVSVFPLAREEGF